MYSKSCGYSLDMSIQAERVLQLATCVNLRKEGNAISGEKEKGQVQDLPLHSDNDKTLDCEIQPS